MSGCETRTSQRVFSRSSTIRRLVCSLVFSAARPEQHINFFIFANIVCMQISIVYSTYLNSLLPGEARRALLSRVGDSMRIILWNSRAPRCLELGGHLTRVSWCSWPVTQSLAASGSRPEQIELRNWILYPKFMTHHFER